MATHNDRYQSVGILVKIKHTLLDPYRQQTYTSVQATPLHGTFMDNDAFPASPLLMEPGFSYV